jgi:ATP-dependent RNA helicase HelY
VATPAQRYAAARARAATPALTAFAADYPFGLDPFQRRACEALEAGDGVLVAAPTGAGKTVVGEFAVFQALRGGTKCFYTTPIKALSNQKYADLVLRHGPDKVGLLTGDQARNGDAPVVVMTTEVLRNMLYAGSPALRGLSHVVMDEVHYLSDRFRGAVWEEVIIHLPAAVTLVSLSATVSNAEEFGEWLITVRGHTAVVVEEHRPVPLWQHVLAGPRLFDLFVDEDQQTVNPALLRIARDQDRLADQFRAAGRARGPRRPGARVPRPPGGLAVPSRPDVVERLDREGLLPAITFVFSRAGCDAAVAQCRRAGLRLTTPAERDAIRLLAEARTEELTEGDLVALRYGEWLDGLERGLAAHHAGMLPTFKEITEELFTQGLVKAVFATETLALGINMPARSVVLEKLSKWNGEAHADVTAGEYTQLTGRAGRRGIDVEGHAVVLWTPGLDPGQVAGLASTRTYPLRSSFRPSYNMAVNLVGTVGREQARTLLAQSFAQFQADRSVVGLARQVARNEEALTGYNDAVRCDRGDIGGYLGLRRALAERESALARTGAAARRAATAQAFSALRPGDVIELPSGRHAGVAVVVGTGEPGPVVVTSERQVRRLAVTDVPVPPQPLGRIRLPRALNVRSPQARRDLVSTLRAEGHLDRPAGGRARNRSAEDPEIHRLRAELRAHPCHHCPQRDDHIRWAGRRDQLVRDTDVLRQRVSGRTGSLARTFDRVCAVLDRLGYLVGDGAGDDGRRLARVYSESDLVVVECLRRGLWDQLDPAALAAVVSALLYESRGSEERGSAPVPAGARSALAATAKVWAELHEMEAAHRLDTLRVPDPGFAWAAHRWVGGASLATVLEGGGTAAGELTAGDFVRWCRQVMDLLDQLAGLPDTPVAATARLARAAMSRGVVGQRA